MTIAGPVVLDIIQHFTERWNEVKTRKVSVINSHISKCLDTGIFSIKITRVMIGWPFPIMFRYLQMKPSSVRTHSPAYFRVVSQSSYTGHPHREHWHQIGRQFKQRFHLEDGEEVDPDYVAAPFGSCNVQVVRSVSDWSHGVLTEHSIQNACKLISNCVYF